MSMCFSTAQARAKRAANFWGEALFLQILASSGSDDMSMCISTAQVRTKRGISYKSCQEPSCRELGACTEIS